MEERRSEGGERESDKPSISNALAHYSPLLQTSSFALFPSSFSNSSNGRKGSGGK